MIGSEIVTMLETLIDDTMDSILAYQLMNNAKDKVEGRRDWEILKKLDNSQSASSGPLTLPTDYVRTLSLSVGNVPHSQIPFEQKNIFANSALRWYLDYRNNSLYLLGNPSGVVNHFYIYQTPEITSSTSPVWPAKFHKLLAFEMAKLFSAVDQGERGFSWDDRWSIEQQLLENAMTDWDVALQKRATENAAPFDYEAEYPLSMM